MNTDSLTVYYKTFFPSKDIYDWLTLGEPEATKKSLFVRRELVFVKSGSDGTMKFMRAHFKQGTLEEFKTLLLKDIPIRIESSTINSVPYYERVVAGPGFSRLEKDIGMDIDIDEYDPVRICCKNDKFCKKCWCPLMGTAIKFISVFLDRTFGLDNIFWVYSGRRGMHCWIVDSKYRKTKQNIRESIVKKLDNMTDITLLSFEPCVPQEYKKIIIDGLNLYLESCPDLFGEERILDKIFRDIYDTQTDIGYQVYFASKKNLSILYDKHKNSRKAFDIWLKKSIYETSSQQEKIRYRVGLVLCRPRIDYKVTTQYSHCQKIPFCIHPRTKNVCMALSISDAMHFFPSQENVISLESLVSTELDKKVHDKFQKSVDVISNAIKKHDILNKN